MAKLSHRSDDDDEDEEVPPRRRSRRGPSDLPAGTPTIYVHEKCKGQTEMPDDVVRDYLENPFELGDEPTTVCTRCDKDVPWSKCYWIDTEQFLDEYLDDLRAEMILAGNDPRPESPGFNWLFPVIGAVLGGAAGAGVGNKAGNLVLLAAIGVVVGAAGGAAWMFVDRNRNATAFAAWNRKLLKRYYKRHPEAEGKSKKRSRRADGL